MQTKNKKRVENRREDIRNSITKIVADEHRNLSNNIVFYNKNGKSNKESTFKEKDACAAKVMIGKSTVYKIKGTRNGRIYNPLLDGSNYSLSSLDKLTKEPMFKFKETTQDSFLHYIKFLQTRYDSWLHKAERDF